MCLKTFDQNSRVDGERKPSVSNLTYFTAVSVPTPIFDSVCHLSALPCLMCGYYHWIIVYPHTWTHLWDYHALVPCKTCRQAIFHPDMFRWFSESTGIVRILGISVATLGVKVALNFARVMICDKKRERTPKNCKCKAVSVVSSFRSLFYNTLCIQMMNTQSLR